ncbi:tachylectin-related carbohydrate-binding protein [Micromonospora phytophila]|uniref:N,N-dimethylformamidase beta subunit family domain-containing protein n=1 Tax=Micromonospora phytophila TaxID=709888 RepID=UPI002030E627|nr:N,N-dimethylformamidase beta subunit family domain-containing protein [Micromonospora phytophila]MCM0674110.1 tachylectin-related carbohydrate-binding protein [Micromonospora phytophila]
MSEANPDGVSRRRVLRDGAIIAAAVPPMLMIEPGSAPARAAEAITVDPQQRFIRLAGGGNGVIYAIQADGSLLWYRHLGWQTGTASWASGSGRRIGSGWHEYRAVFGGNSGSLYGVRADGTVHLRRYVLTDSLSGAGTWVDEGEVGRGFDRYPRLAGFNGSIYGQDNKGRLYWHHHVPALRRWTAAGLYLGTGFQDGVLQADDFNVIYAYRYGNLHWYRHLGGPRWASGSGIQLGGGYRNMGYNDGLWFAGQGVLYGVPPDPATATQTGTLIQHRLLNYRSVGPDNRAVWANNGVASKVGRGWTMQSRAALQGYPNTPSVKQGETVRVAVSTGFTSLTASLVRLAPNTAEPTVVTDPIPVTGGIQQLPPGFVTVGCGWQDRLTYQIPDTWEPGLYAARLEGPHRLRRYVPFIVRPAQVTNPIAVLLPTFTYNAYNTWGGHSQYCKDLAGRRPFTTRRPSSEWNVDDPAMRDHTLFSDLMLLRWMARQGLAYDCYEDMDLHASGTWLTQYRVLVLASHPEYWSDAMRQNLVNYQAGGGRIIYAGGNGLYERVQVDASRTVVTYRRSDGLRDVYSALGLPASQLVGVNYSNHSTYAPYKVLRDHELLAGTGLTVGSTFGRNGYNGAASGWETDAMVGLAGEATESQVIARGQNPGGGAAMVFMEKQNGALVFSASSISFVAALDSDPAMSTLFRNVFDRMLEPGPAVLATKVPMERTRPAPAVPEPMHLD